MLGKKKGVFFSGKKDGGDKKSAGGGKKKVLFLTLSLVCIGAVGWYGYQQFTGLFSTPSVPSISIPSPVHTAKPVVKPPVAKPKEIGQSRELSEAAVKRRQTAGKSTSPVSISLPEEQKSEVQKPVLKAQRESRPGGSAEEKETARVLPVSDERKEDAARSAVVTAAAPEEKVPVSEISEAEIMTQIKQEQLNIVRALQEELKLLSMKMLRTSARGTKALEEILNRAQDVSKSWMVAEETKKVLQFYSTYAKTERDVLTNRLSVLSSILDTIKKVNSVFAKESEEAAGAAPAPKSGETVLSNLLDRLNVLEARSRFGALRKSGEKGGGSEESIETSTVSPLESEIPDIALLSDGKVVFADGSFARPGQSVNGWVLKRVNVRSGKAVFCKGKTCKTLNG